MNAVNNFMAIMFLAVFTLALTGCSKGDDPEPGPTPTPTPTPTYYNMGVLDKTTGLRFKSYKPSNGNIRSVNYADNGRINNFLYADRISYIFSYDPNQIIYVEGDKQRNYNIEYNEDGYLVRWSGSYSVNNDDGKKITYRSNASFSYSGGHLTNVTYRETVEEDTKTEEEWKGDITLTWHDNQLQSMVGVEEEHGEIDKFTATFTYGNSNYKNVYRQWTPWLVDDVLMDLPYEIAFVGLIGPGPDMLPSRVYYGDETDTYTYGFNSDGSLSYTIRDGSRRYDFSYDYKK